VAAPATESGPCMHEGDADAIDAVLASAAAVTVPTSLMAA